MSWNVNVTIRNNTNWMLGIDNNYMSFVQLNTGDQYTWNTDMTNNANAIRFWGKEAPYEPPFFMEGNLSFGPEAGVYVDRGWLDPNDQSVSMTVDANGKTWTQTGNGGETLLQWNEFEQGGSIVMTFNLQ
jgi:hypothetical protein